MTRQRRSTLQRVIRAAAAMASAILLLVPLLAAPSAQAAPHASFSQIEGDMMCVVCHEPLVEANSPEAVDERNYIRALIAKGEDKRQIESAMVAAYGPAVLALPPAHGFNLLVYVVPPLLVVVGITVVLVTLPRWRGRRRAAAAQPIAAGAALDPADARRLDEDLSRFA